MSLSHVIRLPLQISNAKTKEQYAQLNWLISTCTRTHTRTCAHTQSLQQPCETQLLPHSEPALGCLCTTQALKPCAGKSSWGRASNPQEDHPSLTDRGHRTKSSTTILHCRTRKGQLGIASPLYTKYPLMLLLGRLLPQFPIYTAGKTGAM